MSTIRNPVGPQSPKVYWRRRLIVLLGLLAVIVVIVLIVVRPGTSSGEPGGTTPAPQLEPTSIPTEQTAAEGAPCDPQKVRVEAITDASTYGPDDRPQLSVAITNTGTNACVINAGTNAQVFTITSGDEVYWTSTDCQIAPVDAEVLLEPNKPISSSEPIVWDRTRSSVDTCDAARDPVPAGDVSYHLSVTVGGAKAETTKQFILH